MRYSRIAAVVMTCGTLAPYLPLLADNDMRDRKQIRAAANDVEEARDKLRELSRKVEDAQKEVTRAEYSRKVAQQRLQTLRDELEKKHPDQPRVTVAREELKAAQAALDDASRPVIKDLHADKKYIDAVWEAKQARIRIPEVQRDRSLEPAEQRKLLNDLSRATLMPIELERSAIVANPRAQSARTAFDRATIRLSVATRRMDDELDKDPELRKLQKGAEQTKSAVTHAKEQLAQKQSQVMQAKQRLSREENQLVQVRLRHQIETERQRRNRDRK